MVNVLSRIPLFIYIIIIGALMYIVFTFVARHVFRIFTFMVIFIIIILVLLYVFQFL